jgi:hypothetical protein
MNYFRIVRQHADYSEITMGVRQDVLAVLAVIAGLNLMPAPG